MGNFFEEELKKVCSRVGCLKRQKYVSSVCYGEIGKDLRASIVFCGSDSTSYYSLFVKIINRTIGMVDSIQLDFEAVLGRKRVENPNYENGVAPRVQVNTFIRPEKPEWFVYEPVGSDYEALAKALADYLSVFADESYKEET